MILSDVHTHTTFSADGIDDIETMVKEAERLGISYYGISEHFDYDYLVNGITFGKDPASYIDAERYFTKARALQKGTKLNLLVGGEFGFTPNEKAFPLYQNIIETYHPDFVVNSIHSNGISDYYFKESYVGKTKEESFAEYLSLVKKSLSAPYDYDIVSHFLYPERYAPYDNRFFDLRIYASEIDDVLKEIIDRDKILEANSSAKGAHDFFLPGVEVMKRYYALGGRKVSFASDAHGKNRILEHRDQIVSALKEIGFTHITVPKNGKHILLEI